MTTAPVTTETILQEDGAHAALATLAAEVAEAEDSIRSVLDEDRERSWSIRDLQDAASRGKPWSTAMSIAFLRLLKSGEMQVDYVNGIVSAA